MLGCPYAPGVFVRHISSFRNMDFDIGKHDFSFTFCCDSIKLGTALKHALLQQCSQRPVMLFVTIVLKSAVQMNELQVCFHHICKRKHVSNAL